MYTFKKWSKGEEDRLMQIPFTDKKTLKSDLTKIAKEMKRSYVSVWQKHHKLINGLYKRRGKDEAFEYEVSTKTHKRRKPRKSAKNGQKRGVSKKGASPKRNNLVKVNRKSVIVHKFTSLQINGNKIKIIL